MKSTVHEPAPCRRTLEIEVPAEEVRNELELAARRLAKEVSVPGFRKGRAPASLIRKRYGKDIEEEVIERLTREYSLQVIEEKELIPVTAPRVEEQRYQEGEPLTFRTVFEIRPRFELGSYKGLEVVRKRPAVDEELVAKHLETLREQNARLEAVEDRPLAEGDVPLVDMQKVGPGGEPEGEPQVGVALDLRPEASPEALRTGLAGLPVGETRQVEIPRTAPPEGEEEPPEPSRYRVTLKAVRRRVLPALDDEFAKDVGPFETLEDLEKRLREDLERRADDQAEANIREQLLEQLVAAHAFPAPEALVDHELNRMLEDLAGAMLRQGLDPSRAGLDWKEKRQELRPAAEKHVRAELILEEVARAEGLEVTDAEVLAALQRQAARENSTPAALKKRLEQDGLLNQLKIKMLRDKALDRIVGSANIIG